MKETNFYKIHEVFFKFYNGHTEEINALIKQFNNIQFSNVNEFSNNSITILEQLLGVMSEHIGQKEKLEHKLSVLEHRLRVAINELYLKSEFLKIPYTSKIEDKTETLEKLQPELIPCETHDIDKIEDEKVMNFYVLANILKQIRPEKGKNPYESAVLSKLSSIIKFLFHGQNQLHHLESRLYYPSKQPKTYKIVDSHSIIERDFSNIKTETLILQIAADITDSYLKNTKNPMSLHEYFQKSLQEKGLYSYAGISDEIISFFSECFMKIDNHLDTIKKSIKEEKSIKEIYSKHQEIIREQNKDNTLLLLLEKEITRIRAELEQLEQSSKKTDQMSSLDIQAQTPPQKLQVTLVQKVQIPSSDTQTKNPLMFTESHLTTPSCKIIKQSKTPQTQHQTKVIFIGGAKQMPSQNTKSKSATKNPRSEAKFTSKKNLKNLNQIPILQAYMDQLTPAKNNLDFK